MKTEYTEKWVKLIAEDGYVITSYQDGDDIETYTYCKVLYSPLNSNLDMLREITEEEHNKILEKLELLNDK